MQTYDVTLSCEVFNSYRCKRAADSLDIDVKKKSVHNLRVVADLKTPYNIGLIIGASGSGKTTLAKQIFGEDCFKSALDNTKPIIEQFPEEYEYKTCADILSGVGLTQVPCWLRPVYTLSNGQKARAEAALLMCREGLTIIDEWTSVVDRTVAKVMSHCIQKHARKQEKQIVLLSCHYDVVDWLNPDWIIDCNKQEYIDRRLLRQSFERQEKLQFDVRPVGRETWKYFSKYHYLSERLPAGYMETYGLFYGVNQIGFISYVNYVPHRPGTTKMLHANRIVIHPDYAGMGLGILLTNETAKIMKAKGFRIMCKFSSVPVYKSMQKASCWKLRKLERIIIKKPPAGNMNRKAGFREQVKTYSFEYVG